jgi:hypothetical protein
MKYMNVRNLVFLLGLLLCAGIICAEIQIFFVPFSQTMKFGIDAMLIGMTVFYAFAIRPLATLPNKETRMEESKNE